MTTTALAVLIAAVGAVIAFAVAEVAAYLDGGSTLVERLR